MSTLSDLYAEIKSRAENDLSIASSDLTIWIDRAIRRINQTLKTNFPITSGKPDTYIPEFDEQYHEALVIFAQAMYRESDADFRSSQYYLNEFTDMLGMMQRDMVIPPSYRNDPEVQQIIVTDATVLTYNLTMPWGSYFDEVDVYQNNKLVDSSTWQIDQTSGTITFVTLTLAANDKITINFSLDQNLNTPPYQWWGSGGW